MNRVDRLTGTLLLLQSHRSLSAVDIAAHWEISERTVYRDLAALSEAGVPIYFEAGTGYRLMDGYEMSPIMLSISEAMALFMSGEIAEKLADLSLKDSLKSALLKIRTVLPEAQQKQLERFKDSIGVWIHDKHQPTSSASLIPLHRAVVERKCLEIEYNKQSRGELSKRVVEPLGVIYYSGHWHLIAFCRMRSDYRDFRMDRMHSWSITDETFANHKDFSVQAFVSSWEEPKLFSIVLHTNPKTAQRMKRDLHFSTFKESPIGPERVELEIQGFSVDWAAHWLIGYGTYIEVKKPDTLRDRMKELALEIAQQY